MNPQKPLNAAPEFLPERVREFIPRPSEGYLEGLPLADGRVLVQSVSWPDAHPWKDYSPGKKVIVSITAEEWRALIGMIRKAQSAAEEAARKEAEASLQREAEFSGWVQGLPERIDGFRVNKTPGQEAIEDDYGNVVYPISLSWTGQTLDQIQQKLDKYVEFMLEGGGE